MEVSPYIVTLSTTAANEIPRRLKLGTSPVIVGRASKTESRGAIAKSDNALFECPVISREHAKIQAHESFDGDTDITITDCKSMHGTFVNGDALTPNVPFSLQDGDMIQLGTSVARGNDTYKGVTVVFKKGDFTFYDDGRSTRSTYSVPAESDVASEVSDYYGDDFDEVDYDEGDFDDLEESPHKDTEDETEEPYDMPSDDEPEAETQMEDITIEKEIGSQQKPIDLESWQTGSVRNIMDLTCPEPRTVMLPPAPQPARLSYTNTLPALSTNLTEKQCEMLDQICSKTPATSSIPVSCHITDEPVTLSHGRQPSIELSTPLLSTAKSATSQETTSKPRYDPVRGSPPRSSATMTGSSAYRSEGKTISWEELRNAHQSSQATFAKAYAPSVPLPPLSVPAPVVSVPLVNVMSGNTLEELLDGAAKTVKKSKKRKADSLHTSEGAEALQEALKALDVANQPSPPKKAKTTQPSRMQSFISDARKYAFGAALGATGTFTFLASPLGGALADWASKF